MTEFSQKVWISFHSAAPVWISSSVWAMAEWSRLAVAGTAGFSVFTRVFHSLGTSPGLVLGVWRAFQREEACKASGSLVWGLAQGHFCRISTKVLTFQDIQGGVHKAMFHVPMVTQRKTSTLSTSLQVLQVKEEDIFIFLVAGTQRKLFFLRLLENKKRSMENKVSLKTKNSAEQLDICMTKS